MKIEIDPMDRRILETLASNRMQVAATAKQMYMHRNTVVYHIQRIKKRYGLDAMNFYDLQKLLGLAKAQWKCQRIGDDECKGLCSNPQCPMAGEKCPVPDRHGVCRFEAIGGELNEETR